MHCKFQTNNKGKKKKTIQLIKTRILIINILINIYYYIKI